jgi:hypothetical protein
MSILFKSYTVCVTQGDPFSDVTIIVHTLTLSVWLLYAFKIIQNNNLREFIDGCCAFAIWFAAVLLRDFIAIQIPYPQCNSLLMPSIYGFPHADTAFLVCVLTQLILQEQSSTKKLWKIIIYCVVIFAMNIAYYYAYLADIWQLVVTTCIFICLTILVYKLTDAIMEYFLINKPIEFQ